MGTNSRGVNEESLWYILKLTFFLLQDVGLMERQ